jgi:hypothetical protein
MEGKNMATFALDRSGDEPARFQFTFINHSNTGINYDIRTISGDPENFGNIVPAATRVSNVFYHGLTLGKGFTLEYGDIAVVGIGQFGQAQLVPAPGVRFWSGFLGTIQYINLLAGNGYTVTQDSESFSEVTGNGFRITVDGGGHTPTTSAIFFQVYNA